MGYIIVGLQPIPIIPDAPNPTWINGAALGSGGSEYIQTFGDDFNGFIELQTGNSPAANTTIGGIASFLNGFKFPHNSVAELIPQNLISWGVIPNITIGNNRDNWNIAINGPALAANTLYFFAYKVTGY